METFVGSAGFLIGEIVVTKRQSGDWRSQSTAAADAIRLILYVWTVGFTSSPR
jgi:hypothetical protein